MGVLQVLQRINKSLKPSPTSNEKLTPNEVELKAYKERERLDNIKKELAYYRNKNKDEIFKNTWDHKNTILAEPKKKHDIRKAKSTILTGKGNLLGFK